MDTVDWPRDEHRGQETPAMGPTGWNLARAEKLLNQLKQARVSGICDKY
jgi:hypothetical protein